MTPPPAARRECRNPDCGLPTTHRTDLFCRSCYRRLPAKFRRGLWQPLYGGSAHIQACIEALKP